MTYHQQWYMNNREKVYKTNKKYYIKKRQYIDNYKISHGCSICGYNKCAGALCFHHNGDKDFGIGSKISVGMETIKKEMEKCIVLCMNCHAELHEKLRGGVL